MKNLYSIVQQAFGFLVSCLALARGSTLYARRGAACRELQSTGRFLQKFIQANKPSHTLHISFPRVYPPVSFLMDSEL